MWMRSTIRNGSFAAVGLLFFASGVATSQRRNRPLTPPATFRGEIAVVEHHRTGVRLALVRAETKQWRSVTELAGGIANVVWSPDGKRLVCRIDGNLVLVDPESGRQARFPGVSLPVMPSPRSFAPVGEKMAILRPNGVVIIDAAVGVADVELPGGSEAADLLWTPSGDQLLVLLRTNGMQSIARIDPAARKIVSEVPAAVTKLVGWRNGRGHLLAAFTSDFDQPVEIDAAGAVHAIETGGEGTEGFISAYSPATDRLLLARFGEHSSDPVELFLTHPGLMNAQRWLASMRHIDPPSFSSDGQWAVFIDRSKPSLSAQGGGDLYIVRTAGVDPLLVRAAEPGGLTFSDPAIRPTSSR